MERVNIHQAKTQLSQLLQLVEQGEEVVIVRAGVPIARRVSWQPAVTPLAAEAPVRVRMKCWLVSGAVSIFAVSKMHGFVITSCAPSRQPSKRLFLSSSVAVGRVGAA